MKHTREQKRAALLAQAQALIEEFLDWEEQAERPNRDADRGCSLGPAGAFWPRASCDGAWGSGCEATRRHAAVSHVQG